MLKTLFISIIFLLGAVSSDDTSCDSGWVARPFSDSCYLFSKSTLNNEDAIKKCNSFGGSTVSINSEQEQLFLQSIQIPSND